MASKSIKLDKNDELLMAFEKEPVGGAHLRSVREPKPVRKPSQLEGVDSWTILTELVKRHIIDLQVVGFWCLLFGIVLF